MGFGKFLGCVVGGAVAVVAAPAVLGAAAVVGTAAAGAAATAGAAVASTAVGGAAIGAASTVGAAAATGASAVAGAAATAGAAVASTTVGGAAIGAATTVGGAVATGAGTVGGVVVGAGEAIAASSLVGASTALEVGVAGALGTTATYTGITSVEGINNMFEAEEMIEKATNKYDKTSKKLKKVEKKTAEKLEALNFRKYEIYSVEIKKAVDIIEKIKQPKERKIDFSDNTQLNFFTEKELGIMSDTAIKSSEIVNNVINGVSLLKASSSSTLAFTTQFGVASTGTAISQLHGVAAYNATIAALGGGSLAAGGGGMALGHAVLGGVTLAPAAVIGSWKFAKESEKKLTAAKEHYSKIEIEVEKMINLMSILEHGVNVRIDEIESVLNQMALVFNDKVYPDLLKSYQDYKNIDGKLEFNNCPSDVQDKIMLSVYFIRKWKDIISVKVLDENGNPSIESKRLVDELNADKALK